MCFDSKSISSCHINFLFGAGVNGKAFPQLNGFKKTMSFLESRIADPENKSFEDMMNELQEKDKGEARKLFIDEFKSFEISKDSESLKHLKSMFKEINEIITKSENRTVQMNQVNIYTLNYDTIVENSLCELGYLNNSVSASSLNSHQRFINLIGYDYLLKKDIPTYLVYKIHGDIDDPVLPGVEKFQATLMANKFQILFHTKEKMIRPNSILIVIGYSGADEHINRIIGDCVELGLTVYWYSFSREEKIPECLVNKVEHIKGDGNEDTTLRCAEDLKKVWGK